MKDSTNKIKIETIENRDIYFDRYLERFIVGNNEYSSLSEAKRAIKRDLETEFKGEYFIKDSFNGILRFAAQMKIYDEYEGEYKIIGKLYKNGNDRGEFTEEELYPINEFNEAQEKKAKEMNSEGWRLINQAKILELKK